MSKPVGGSPSGLVDSERTRSQLADICARGMPRERVAALTGLNVRLRVGATFVRASTAAGVDALWETMCGPVAARGPSTAHMASEGPDYEGLFEALADIFSGAY